LKVLDCESIDSTYNSLESILEVDRSAIDSILNDVNFEDFHKGNPYHAPSPVDHLFCAVRTAFPSRMDFDQTCWFHITRTVETNTYEQGILPTGQQIDSIWNFLYSLLDGSLSKKEWNKFRRNISKSNKNPAYQYGLRIKKPIYWGPFAFLVKDIAFKAKEVRNTDFFQCPEIVEIICGSFSEYYKFDLFKAFHAKTKPCIVKFVHDGSGREYYMRAALNYLHSIYKGSGYNDYCNHNFDGKGTPVPKDRILQIEFPRI